MKKIIIIIIIIIIKTIHIYNNKKIQHEYTILLYIFQNILKYYNLINKTV